MVTNDKPLALEMGLISCHSYPMPDIRLGANHSLPHFLFMTPTRDKNEHFSFIGEETEDQKSEEIHLIYVPSQKQRWNENSNLYDKKNRFCFPSGAFLRQ